MKKYRCTWCCKDSSTSPCEYCKSDSSIYVKGEKHICDWSRKTINTMECKICDRVISNEEYFNMNYEN